MIVLRICLFWAASAITLMLGHSVYSDDEPGKKEVPSVIDSREQETLLTIDRIFDAKEFELKDYSARWIEGTSSYTLLTEVKDDQDHHEIRRYAAATGAYETIVAKQDLIPKGESAPLEIDDYELSNDQSKVLIYTNAQRVWRKNTRGDYWLFDCSTRQLVKLGGEEDPATMMFAKFSPDGKQVAYVRNRNIYLQDLSDLSQRCLTYSDNENIINGTTDWVYEEEFQVRDGFRWSPDGKLIAYWQIDTTGVDQFPLVNNTDSLYPEVTWFAYPKVGQRNPSCRIGVVDIESGNSQWIQTPGEPHEHYIPRMDWAESSEELIVQQLNRLQNCNKLFLADVTTGEVTTVLKEEDAAWVDVHHELLWLEDGTKFVWISERDGWRHAYLVSRNGEESLLLTPGDYDVIKLLQVDEKHQCFYFIASPDDPTQRYLFRGSLDGSPAQKLTQPEANGVHDYQFSEDSEWAIHRTSHADWPGQTELISIPEHKTVRLLEENKIVADSVRKLALNPVEFFRVDIGDGIELDGWCITPPDFDPNASYPLLIYVYGEPAGSTVVDQWGKSNHLWHFMLSQKGYVVMSFDNRGTHVPRGREWRKSIYTKIGILPPQDQAAAVRAVLKERTYLDPKRVGIWGWSGGGSSSLQAIFKYPDLYSTAIAVASVPDQRYYDTIYQERYMGLPESNPEAFREGSPINFAQNLEGKLLLVHGTGDDNCHYQTLELLIDKLVACNKQFSLMAYPNRTHAIKERENTERHLRELMTRFLLQHLPVNEEL
ncbi:MAG TPA: S9 family peptidase [Planctomycetaceae bacterium]|nr:S9 family peptidase [Rubinisphaera sp.]HCS51774.1 S9 family peptidase [Planctomycetaceae bacterium]|tara:strand:- start:431 stop:2734 length:2304 start_codon:yes stop_codon:yes gene_type:complete